MIAPINALSEAVRLTFGFDERIALFAPIEKSGGILPRSRPIETNAVSECIGDSSRIINDENSVLYEQVTDVNSFSLLGAFAFAVAFVVALHRVCIRTLMSRMNLDSVPVGVREECRCCDLSDGLGGPKRRRSHRNAVWVATGELYAAC